MEGFVEQGFSRFSTRQESSSLRTTIPLKHTPPSGTNSYEKAELVFRKTFLTEHAAAGKAQTHSPFAMADV